MQLKPTENRKLDLDDSLVPMINVVFLLLIFFMVAGTFKLIAPVDIDIPDSSRTQLSNLERILFVDETATIYIDNNALSLEEAGNTIINNAWHLDISEDLPLTLNVDKNINIADFRKVVAMIRQTGITEVELLTNHSSTSSAADNR